MVRTGLAFIGAFALTATPLAARADDGDDPTFTIGPRPVWFVTAGGGAGATIAADQRGGLVGGELSLVRLNDNHFLGLYADAYYDFGLEGAYFTAGPELGLIRRSRTFPIGVGVDGGPALRLAERSAVGGAGRLFVSFAGIATIFGRYAYVVAFEDAPAGSSRADDDAHVVQIGMTFKFPIGPPFGAGTADAGTAARRD